MGADNNGGATLRGSEDTEESLLGKNNNFLIII